MDKIGLVIALIGGVSLVLYSSVTMSANPNGLLDKKAS